jgi:hypothetical protein
MLIVYSLGKSNVFALYFHDRIEFQNMYTLYQKADSGKRESKKNGETII